MELDSRSTRITSNCELLAQLQHVSMSSESIFPSYINRDPAEYSCHDLMKLSVFARPNEI